MTEAGNVLLVYISGKDDTGRRHHRGGLRQRSTQIFAEFFPGEEVPARAAAVLRELFG